MFLRNLISDPPDSSTAWLLESQYLALESPSSNCNDLEHVDLTGLDEGRPFHNLIPWSLVLNMRIILELSVPVLDFEPYTLQDTAYMRWKSVVDTDCERFLVGTSEESEKCRE